MLVSYNVNGACKSECNGLVGSIPADSYRPKFVRVPWKILDPNLSCTAITSLKDNLDPELFSIFPNPSHGTIEIKMKTIHNYFSLQIMNINGQIILNKSFLNATDRIRIELKESGMFLIKINCGQNYFTKKLLICH